RKMDDFVALGAAAPVLPLAASLDQDQLFAADETSQVSLAQRVAQLEELGQPTALLCLVHVVAELERRREGPGRILETEHSDETDPFDQSQRLLEVAASLSGEADDDVGRQRQPRHGLFERFDALDVLRHGVASDHSLEHAI